MKECLIYLTYLDYQEMENILTEKLKKLVILIQEEQEILPFF